MKIKHSILCAFLLAVAASSARAQQPPAPAPMFDARIIETESEGAFAGRAADLRKIGEWNQLSEIGRVRRAAHPEESIGWHAEALGAYGNGDAQAAIAAWKAAPNLGGIPDAASLLMTAESVARNYPGRKFEPLQFLDVDPTLDRSSWSKKADDLLKAKDYDAIEATAGELQKSDEKNALGRSVLQTFFVGLSEPDKDPKPLQEAIADWRTARPNSDLARLAEIAFSTRLAWRARGNGYVNTITPVMSEAMSNALENGAQNIQELSAKAVESPLTFQVLRNWGQLGGDGRPFQDAIYAEGRSRFPTDQGILSGRINDLLPQWFGTEGELTQLLKEHADQIGGIEGDVDYALGNLRLSDYRTDDPSDQARFLRGLDTLYTRFPDSVTLRANLVYYHNKRGKIDGNYEVLKAALSSPQGYLTDGKWYGTPIKRAYASELRMEILAKPKPQ